MLITLQLPELTGAFGVVLQRQLKWWISWVGGVCIRDAVSLRDTWCPEPCSSNGDGVVARMGITAVAKEVDEIWQLFVASGWQNELDQVGCSMAKVGNNLVCSEARSMFNVGGSVVTKSAADFFNGVYGIVVKSDHVLIVAVVAVSRNGLSCSEHGAVQLIQMNGGGISTSAVEIAPHRGGNAEI